METMSDLNRVLGLLGMNGVEERARAAGVAAYIVDDIVERDDWEDTKKVMQLISEINKKLKVLGKTEKKVGVDLPAIVHFFMEGLK